MQSKKKTSTDLQQTGEIEISAQELMIATAAGPLNAIYIAQQVGGLEEKLKATSEENAKLREKVKTIKNENASMGKKIGELEKNNRRQIETIRSLEQGQEKLQRDLETVSKAKDKLRIKVEEKNSKFSKENEILMEKLDTLTKDFAVVENENKDLKRSLAELTSDNTFLKEEVISIKKENEKLQNKMGELQEKHNKIQEKHDQIEEKHDKIEEQLGRKETRLAIGQVAWILEAEIWKNVLPNVKMGTTQILNSMERWLKKNKGKKEGDDAQKRWKELKSKLNWDEAEHKPALKMLKKLRLGDAHPTVVDLEEASKQLEDGDYIAEPDKEFCQQIIDMVKTTKSLNEMKQ